MILKLEFSRWLLSFHKRATQCSWPYITSSKVCADAFTTSILKSVIDAVHSPDISDNLTSILNVIFKLWRLNFEDLRFVFKIIFVEVVDIVGCCTIESEWLLHDLVFCVGTKTLFEVTDHLVLEVPLRQLG